MAKFLTTRGTASEIEKIINNATKSIVLITPFVRIPNNLFQNLRAADKRDVRITLIYGKKDLERDVYEQLRQLRNLSIHYLEDLHAKCYFNELHMVVTSLNLYDFSEQNNIEMGVLITRKDDEEAFKEAVREVKMILSIVQKKELREGTDEHLFSKTANKVKPTPKETEEGIGATLLKGFADILLDKVGIGRGFCIGCKTRIEYDEYKSFCPDCYKQWVKNKSLKANYCHLCGQATTTTINKPICRVCWEKTKENR